MTIDDTSVAGTDPIRDSGGGVGQVAIVGSGPSGCFTALAVRRLLPTAHIVVFDARPTPYGLVRYGVAPDHQGMKNISRQFDRLFTATEVDFVGNVRIGQNVSLTDLQNNFDVVVLATGLPVDRPLDIPVAEEARVVGAGQLLRLLNGDPDSTERDNAAPLGSDVVILGAGNVAIDVMRLLCKDDSGFIGSDIDDDARDALVTSAVERITVIARGPRDQARWDGSMFSELCALPGVSVSIDDTPVETSTATAVPDTTATRSVAIDMHFNQPPTQITHDGTRSAVHTRPRGADTATPATTYSADTVITARGFIAPTDDAATDTSEHPTPVIRVGGCDNGALGNLAENRAAAKTAAQRIAAALTAPSGRPGLTGIADTLVTSVSFDDWTLIDRAETDRARPDRLRTKFTTWHEMTDAISAHRS